MSYTKELLNTKIYDSIDKHYKDWFQIKYKNQASIIIEISHRDLLEFNFDNASDSFETYNHIIFDDIIIYVDNIFKKDYHSVIDNLIYISSLSSFTGIYV